MAEILVHADPHAHDGHHGHHAVDPGPTHYRMASGTRTLLLGGIALGVVCLVLSFFFDPVDAANGSHFHSRFWSNWLHNSTFFLGVSFLSLFLVAAKVLIYSGWHTVFKRVWEAYAQFLPVAIGLFIPIVAGLFLHWHHLYHWSDFDPAGDALLAGKSAFLNPIWYTAAALGVVAVWYFAFAIPLRKLSIEEDERGTDAYAQHRRMRTVAGIFVPIAAFSSAAVVWLVVMSIDAHWYSTLFAWYATASWLVSAVGLTIVLLIFLKTLGYFGQVTTEHLHDLGKYMFAFSIFWTYLWFSQFMLIWYGNVGEETVYFQTRMDEFPVLFWANLAINFILPFFVLMPNTTKRKYGPLAFVAIMVVFGHWLDYFQMIKPGVLETTVHAAHAGGHTDEAAIGMTDADAGHSSEAHTDVDQHTGLSTTEYVGDEGVTDTYGMTGVDGEEDAMEDHAGDEHSDGHHGESHFYAGFTIPGLIEIGTFIGFLSLFFLVALTALAKARLVPWRDPYLEESLHHHV